MFFLLLTCHYSIIRVAHFVILQSMVGVKTASADGQPGEAPNGEDGITLDGEDGNNLPLSVEASIEHFPHKVDRLLNCISKVCKV